VTSSSSPSDEGAARPGEAIQTALEEIARRLQEGDVAAAAGAVARLVAGCEAAAAGGSRLDAPTLARLQPLVQRCVGLAAEGQAALSATLAQLGTGNRANRAYRDE
jgi:hypothetical protein